MRQAILLLSIFMIVVTGWSIAAAQVTGTAQVESPLPLDKQIERYTQIIVGALTALGPAIAPIIYAFIALREKTRALVATVRGAEEAFDKVKASDPKLYVEAKALLKAKTKEISAVTEILTEIHAEENKPHTQEIKVPGRGIIGLMLAMFLISGCATEDYVRADAAAWRHYDAGGRLDLWIDEAEARGVAKILAKEMLTKSDLTPEQASALRKLNDGRRARVAHALGALDKK